MPKGKRKTIKTATEKNVVFANSISSVLESIVVDTKKLIKDTGHDHPIDIGIEFNSVGIDKLGFLFASKTNETSIVVKMATRITKDN